MWALRRASDPLRKVGCTVQISRVCCLKFETPRSLESQTGILNPPRAVSDNCQSLKRFYHSQLFLSKHFVVRCGLSSQAGAEISEDDGTLDDGFSDLGLPANSEAVKEGKADDESSSESKLSDDESSSESELSDDEDGIEDSCLNELELSDHGDKPTPKKGIQSELVKDILANRRVPINSTLDKWIAEGKELDRKEISRTLVSLHRLRLYRKALQVHEWVDSHKLYDLAERDYASQLDLIAKFHGLQKAESYIHSVPESFRGEVLYRTLLANYVGLPNVKKAEEVFGKMKELGFPLTLFTCNQLLLLYSRWDGKKIADILLLMETENVKPDSFTYRMLLDIKGRTNDMAGMDQVLENMKAEGIEPDMWTQTILCRHYINSGMKEKACAIMKQMEGGDLKKNREICQSLITLYGNLGKADEVERVWKVCEPKPWVRECTAAIAAWGRLKKIEEAEAVFQKMSEISKVSSEKIYTALLRVYADNKLLDKGTNLVKQMASEGCRIDPLTWDLLVKLYVNAGDVDKADSLLRRATEKSKEKPLYNSYTTIMYEYAKRGDIHNTEKIFYMMKQRGYMIQMRQFQALVLAYRTAKAPAYGIRERMKADNIIPNRSISMQLTHIDAFMKTAASDLLE